jgi:hypothetical protein
MRKATTALFVVLMFVFSCTKESVTPDLDAGNDVLKKADAAKKVTKTLKFHESTGIMGYTPCSSDVCDTEWNFFVEGTGHATHLGAFTVQNFACTLGPPTFDFIEPLKGVLTASNGDKIFTMVIGTTEDDILGTIYHYMIINGTGRFKAASGYIDMWGIFDYVNWTFDLEGLGEITY